MSEPISSFSIYVPNGLKLFRVVRSPDGRYIYVTAEWGPIKIIDTQSNAVIGEIGEIAPALMVKDAAISPDGNRLFFTDNYPDRVTIVDIPSRAVVATISIMQAYGGRRLAVHPNGRYLYAVGGNTVVIDLVNNSIASVIPVQGRQAALSLDGRELYVTDSSGLTIVDTATNNVVAIIDELRDADQLAVALDGRRLYVSGLTPSSGGWLSVFDTTSRQVITTNELLSWSSGVAVSPDGRYVLVSVPPGSVDVFNTATNKRVTRIESHDPVGPVLWAQGLTVVDQTVYVASLFGSVFGFYIGYLRTHLDSTLIDRTAEFNAPAAAGPPTACVFPTTGMEIISYRDTAGHVHEIWRDANGNTGAGDMTYFANAPTAAGDPFAMVGTSGYAMLYRSTNGEVRSLYPWNGTTGTDNLSGAAGAPNAAGNPVGYYAPAFDTTHVIYRSGDGHLHELFWVGQDAVSYGGNLTAGVSAPKTKGDPAAFVGYNNYNLVVYHATNDLIQSIYWKDGPSGLDNLSGSAGTPPAGGDPVGYYTPHNEMTQVFYRGNDNHLYEIYWVREDAVIGSDLTVAASAPAAAGNPTAYYNAATNTKHLMYRSGDGRLHELWWIPGTSPVNHVDLTQFAGAPLAADRPIAFWVSGTNTNHVAYRGQDKHIYEISWVLW